jgi:hypothetical protein
MFSFEGSVNDHIAVVDVIDPQAITAGATGVLTGAIDMKDYSKVMAIISSGTLGTSGTLDASWTGCATSGGTYAAVTGKAITQLVKASNDNDIVVLECSEEAAAAQGFRYLKLHLVAGTANATSAAVVVGVPANFIVANNADVVEVK